MRALLAGLAIALPLGAQEPVDNARLTRRAGETGLVRALSAASGWVGWHAPSRADRTMCCWESIDRLRAGVAGACRLDRRHGLTLSDGDADLRSLRGDEMRVLVRLDEGAPREVKVFSAGCRVDGGGAEVTWFDRVPVRDSIAALETWVEAEESALAAIAQHAHPLAVDSLLRTARAHRSADTRGHALFWVARRAGDRAAEAIERALVADPDQEVKEKAVFALSQLPRDEGVPLLLRTMQQNRNPEVRRQAAFWLGQSKDPRALRYFEELLGR